MDLLLGSAVLLLPQPSNLALLGAIAAVKGGRALLKRRKAAAESDADEDVAPLPSPGRPKTPASESGVPPVTLEWSEVDCILSPKKGPKKTILNGVAGAARPGRLLALMGPSGSGKSTLLNALAGQMPAAKNITLRGDITVNGVPAGASNHKQAYVEQSDNFYTMLTLSETLHTTGQLQLPPDLPGADKDKAINRLISVLGLSKARDTVIGNDKVRGLSGGEKKRLSIGCELVGSPSLLFLDEPTTGLDAFQAEKVMRTLKELADLGHTVVASIHQPRSSIYALFDDLILLSEGSIVYSGPAEGVLGHFASLGHTCPEHYNPAEFLADLIAIDHDSPEAEAASKARLAQLVGAWEEKAGGAAHHQQHMKRSASGIKALGRGRRRPVVGWGRQFLLLLVRSWRQITRDKDSARSRFLSNLNSALVFGAIFFRMRRKQSSIQDRMGLLQVAAINTAMSSLIKTLYVFPNERSIVDRERARNAYDTLPYLTAKLLAEFPVSCLFPLLFGGVVYPLTGLNRKPLRFLRFMGILTLESFTSAALGLAVGALAPNTESAVAIGPAIMLVWIVFGGYYANAANIPKALRWLPRASLIKHSFEALCINEFKGLTFDLDANGSGMRTGDDVLKWLSFDKTSIPKTSLTQARILAMYYWITYWLLCAKKPRFQQVLPPAGAGGPSRAGSSAGPLAAPPAAGKAAGTAAVPAANGVAAAAKTQPQQPPQQRQQQQQGSSADGTSAAPEAAEPSP